MVISVGDAILKLGVDTKDMDRGLRGLKGTIQKHNKAIGLAMTAMGGAILAVGIKSVKTYAEMGDAVQKMALRTGFSTESLSEWKHTLEISGSSLQALDKGVKRMSMSIIDAGDGLLESVRNFDKLNLSVEDLRELSPEEQFETIAMALAGLEDQTEKAAVAQKIFGRAGTELLPMLAAGADGIKELREEAHKLGIVFDQEAADKAAGMTDAMARLKESLSGVQMVIADHLIPILIPLVDKIKDVIANISAWMKEHPGLTKVIITATGAIGLLLLALGPLLIVLPQLVAAWGILKAFMLTKLIPSIAATTAALWAKVAALYAAMVAMGPAGWAMAAASMALIATGLVLIIKKAKDATSAFTGKVEDYTPAASQADDVTRRWSDGLSELEIVTRRISDAESRLSGVRKKLTEQTSQIDRRQIDLIASSADYIKIQSLMAKANLGSIESAEELVDILLIKINLTEEEIAFLEQYIGRIEKANEAERERQKELEETTKALEELADAQKEATKTVEDAIQELRYERSEAGKLRISINDVISALHLMGRSNEYITDTLVSLGDESSNVLKVMEAFGLTALEVANAIGLEADEVERLTEAAEALREATEIPEAPTVPPVTPTLTPEEYEKILARIQAGGGFASQEEAEAFYRAAAAAQGRIWEPGMGVLPGVAGLTPAGFTGALETVQLDLQRAMEQGLGGLITVYQQQLEELAGIAIGPQAAEIQEALKRAAEASVILGEEPVGLQHGGIAMSPMPAIIAEKQPEAVIPLDRLDSMMGGKQMMTIIYEVDGRQMAKTVMPYAVEEIRLRTGVHI